jgi:hypothetical protein
MLFVRVASQKPATAPAVPTRGASKYRGRRAIAMAESALYTDLISDSYAPSVRLEQERISFSAIEKALADH